MIKRICKAYQKLKTLRKNRKYFLEQVALLQDVMDAKKRAGSIARFSIDPSPPTPKNPAGSMTIYAQLPAALNRINLDFSFDFTEPEP